MNRRVLSALFALALALGGACRRAPATLTKEQYLASGDKFFAERKNPEAIIQYRNAARVDPKLAAAHARLAEAYLRANNTTTANNTVEISLVGVVQFHSVTTALPMAV